MTDPPAHQQAGGAENPPEPTASLTTDTETVPPRRWRHARWGSPSVGQVFAYSDLRPMARFVMAAIGQCVIERTGWAQVGEPELCDMTGASRWTVYRAIADAETADVLIVDRTVKPNRYRLTQGLHDDTILEDLVAETRDPRSRDARSDGSDVAETRDHVAETRDPRSRDARSSAPLHTVHRDHRQPVPLPPVDELMPPPLTDEEQERADRARRAVVAEHRSDRVEEVVDVEISQEAV